MALKSLNFDDLEKISGGADINAPRMCGLDFYGVFKMCPNYSRVVESTDEGTTRCKCTSCGGTWIENS